MSTDPITSVPFYGEDTGTEARLPIRTLDQDDFLKLLVAQMTTQDPLNPTGDLQMIAQMAQFTTLEQSKAMQSDISELRSQQELLQANSLLGRSVEIDQGNLPVVKGEVTAVHLVEGTPKLVVNDRLYDLGSLLSIAPPDEN
jgi:flagellar basal-body rod modification protein FlgD